MNKKLLLLLPLCALALAACRKESFEDRCAREAREFTQRQCPRRMDSFTMMDSIVYDYPARTVNYFYTLEGLPVEDADFIRKLKDELRDLLVRNVINSVELKQHKENKMSFSYKYCPKSAPGLRFDVTVTPDDYERAPVPAPASEEQ